MRVLKCRIQSLQLPKAAVRWTAYSSEADSVRRMLAAGTGQDFPTGQLLIGIVPRSAVEALLTSRCGNFEWREQAWQPQQMLPVVVSTKDGFRFGFFSLEEST